MSVTYDHRLKRKGHPVRSAKLKLQIGGLVVGWVTTSEYPLLYVFCFAFNAFDAVEIVVGWWWILKYPWLEARSSRSVERLHRLLLGSKIYLESAIRLEHQEKSFFGCVAIFSFGEKKTLEARDLLPGLT